MNINAESYGHAVVLHVKGDLTEDTLVAFRQAVDHQLAAKDIIDLVLNLENVPFIDSAGMEFLLDLQGQLAERMGQLKLLMPDENVRKILEITRLWGNFDVFKDLTQAVQAIHA